MNVIVYTALFGDIDRLWSVPPPLAAFARYVCFSDRPRREVGLWGLGLHMVRGTGRASTPTPAWEVRVVENEWGNRRTARHYKALPHRYLDGDVWIWLDANVRLRIKPQEAIRRWLKGGALATFNHPDRGCLYDEAAFCTKKGKDSEKALNRQVARYRKMGMPAGWGLAETRCVMRRDTGLMRQLGEMWWEEIESYSLRDQVSLPYACWQMGLRWKVIPGRVWVKGGNSAFWFIKHRETM